MKTRRARCISEVMLTLILVGCFPRPPTFVAPTPTNTGAPTAVPTNTTIASPEIGTDQIRINQVRRLVDKAGQFVGYEALVLNDSPQDTWVYSATLIVNAGQMLHDTCMSGDLHVLATYFIHLSAKGEVTSTTQEGEQIQWRLRGTITGDPSERYRVQGSLTYASNCPFTSWLIEVNAPLNVLVPAHGHARIQLYFVIDESAVVERQVDTDVAEQLMAGEFQEQDKLVLELQSGNDLEAVFEGELASLLINPIIEKAPDK